MNSNEKLQKIENYAKENYIPIIRKQSCDFLVNLIKKIQPKNILEIGTAIGYSGVMMLLNSKDAKLTTVDKDADRLEIAKKVFDSFNLSERIKVVCEDANIFVQNLSEEYDFIFLDGPKSHYGKELPYLLKNLKVGGYILADNVLFMGEVLSDTFPKHKHRTAILRLREFLALVQNNKNLESEIIHIEDGLLVIKKIK